MKFVRLILVFSNNRNLLSAREGLQKLKKNFEEGLHFNPQTVCTFQHGLSTTDKPLEKRGKLVIYARKTGLWRLLISINRIIRSFVEPKVFHFLYLNDVKQLCGLNRGEIWVQVVKNVSAFVHRSSLSINRIYVD